MGYYVPTKDVIDKVFEGDKKYFDKAAAVVEEWYNLEGAYFDDKESFLEGGYDDIRELADAATNEEERHIVWMALEGYDPYEDEDEEEEDEEEDEDEEK